jgi:hypothetical protein
VLKGCDNPYFSFHRTKPFIKLKKDHVAGLGDTADFAIVGGRRDSSGIPQHPSVLPNNGKGLPKLWKQAPKLLELKRERSGRERPELKGHRAEETALFNIATAPRNSFKTVRNTVHRGSDSFSILKLLVTDLDVLGRLTQSCGLCYPYRCELR